MKYQELGEYNFSVIQGVSQVETFSDWLIDSVPFNLSEATEIRVDFKKNMQARKASLSLTLANNGLVVNGNNLEFHFGENTLGITEGVYLYDILIIKDGKRHTYVRGEMLLTGVVTK